MYSITPGTPVSQIQNSSTQIPENFQNKSKGKASILLIDDDVMLVQALAEFLEDNRYSTKSFTKAEEALQYLKENLPDLVICDVNLETSTFGGFTLHEKMRKFEHLRDVPFIFLSGLNDTAIVLAGKELGADDYLTKPVEPEALLAVVKGKLKRYRQIKKNA
jgi:DNA-binding response OmpR family regulator